MKKIAIIGLGYVGLPLAVAFGKKHSVVGFDIDAARVQDLNQNLDKTNEVSAQELSSLKNLTFTSDASKLRIVIFLSLPFLHQLILILRRFKPSKRGKLISWLRVEGRRHRDL